MPELEMYAKRLLDYVDYQGVCGLNFRYDNNTGRVAYIETNARFTGGLATPIKAGFDILFKGFDGFDDFYMDEKKVILGEMIYYFEKL